MNSKWVLRDALDELHPQTLRSMQIGYTLFDTLRFKVHHILWKLP